MRAITALSVSAASLLAVPASALGQEPGTLVSVNEFIGQTFTPPLIRVELPLELLPDMAPTLSEAVEPDENTVVVASSDQMSMEQIIIDGIRDECTPWVEHLSSHQLEIWLACANQTADLYGYKLYVMTDVRQIATRFGVAIDD